MLNISIKSKSGFTLIEATLYIAISSILILVMTNLGFSFFASRQKSLAEEEIIENAYLVFNKITRAVRTARNINLPLDSGSELSLEMKDSQVNPTRFYLDGTTLMSAYGTGGGVALTTDSVRVTDLEFEKIVNNDKGVSLKIKINFSSDRQDINLPFETTVALHQ